MEYSLKLNNLGALCLDAGCDNQWVLQIFKDSLDEKLQHLSGRSASLTTIEQEQRIAHTKYLINQAAALPSRRQQRRMSLSASFVYTKAILLSDASVQTTTEVMHTFGENYVSIAAAVESAAILYNLGLIHHLIAFSNGSLDHVNTQKARELYEMAFSLVKDSFNGDIGNVDSRIAIAILNNLGQISQETGRFDQANEWFEQLSRMLESTCAARETTGKNPMLSESDWAGLVFNVTILNKAMTAPAPAA